MKHHPLTPDEAVQALQEHWSRGEEVRVEDLLQQSWQLKHDPDAMLDLIYTEILLREGRGHTVEEAEYRDRFPEHADAIMRQFQIHRALDDETDQVNVTTARADATVSLRDLRQSPKPRDQFPKVDGFEIQEIAGRGGSGIAYKAFDQNLKRTVAIKLLHGIDLENDSRRQLIREAEAAAALDHPSIVKIHQIGEADQLPFLVMEYIDGQPLSVLLKEGPLSVADSVRVVTGITNAIQYAHDAGIVHRDLKPGNVLLDQKGQPHVCDFGLARRLDSEYTLHATGDVVGTPAYMSPEQARGETVSEATDVYALGAVLYHCLTGRPPFQAATPWEIMTQVMTNEPPSVRQLNPAVPRDLETICAKAMHKNAARRFESAQAFAEELNRFRSGKPILSRPASRPEKLWKLCRRHPAITSLILVSAVALFGLATVSTISARKVSDALKESEAALAEAEIQRDVAFEAMQNLIYEVHDALQRREASVEARSEVLTSAISGLQQLVDVNMDRDDIRLALAQARNRFGYILTQQGENEAAEKEYFEAARVSEEIDTPDGATESAQSWCNLALFYLRTAQPDSAIEAAIKGIVLAEKVMDSSPDSLQPRLIASRSRAHQSSALVIKEEFDEALKIGLQALAVDRELFEIHPEDRRVRTQLADMDLQISRLHLTFGQLDEAESCIEEAIPLIEAEASKSEEDAELSRRFYTAMHELGKVQFTRMKHAEALASFQRAVDGYRHLVEAEPSRPGYRLKLGSMYTSNASCLLALNRIDDALTDTQNSIEQYREGMQLGGAEYRVQRWAIFQGFMTLSDLYSRRGELEPALAAVRTAVEELHPIVEEYKMQDTEVAISYLAEILAGLLGQDSEAGQTDVEKVQRGFQVYRSAQRGDFAPLIERKEQLNADIDSASRPVVAIMLMSFRCLADGLYFEAMSRDKTISADELEVLAEQATDSARQFGSYPGNNPTFYLSTPELQTLCQTPQFRAAFGLE